MKAALAVLVLLGTVPLFAQEQEQETIFDSPNLDHGGYIAPVVKATKLNGQLGVLAGLRGGLIVDHSVSIGLAGYALVNNLPADQAGPQNQPNLNLYYGGLELQYLYDPSSVVHLTINTLAGVGLVGTRYNLFRADGRRGAVQAEYYMPRHHWGGGWDQDGWGGNGGAMPAPVQAAVNSTPGPGPLTGFFVVEPGASLDFNLTRWWRLNLGGGYRFARDVRSSAATMKGLSGPTAMASFSFGSF